MWKMKPKPNKEFDVFKSEFKKWQTRFGLNGYQLFFRHESLGDCLADIDVDTKRMVATVRLDTRKTPIADVKVSAKHEALHLLIGRLQECAWKRYTTQDEILEADEELVVRLQGLIE